MKRFLCLLLIGLPLAASADAVAVAQLLERIRDSVAAEFNYQETRQLELVSAPWQGQGKMLSDGHGSLVKLQLQPQRIIMAIAGQRMIYWDADQQQRHIASVEQAGAAAGQVTVFRNILQGDIDALQARYDFSAEQQGKLWTLRMTPKSAQNDDEAASVEISGNDDAKQRRIVIRQADGESSTYQLTQVAEGQDSVTTIQRLLREAAGE